MEEINDIPQTIRDQIGSGKIIATIDSINERADIARPDLIPQLIYDVLSKDVPAKDFISHCSSVLKFNQKKLKAVVREIKEKILKQFDYALLNYGVDIKEIDVSDAMTLDEYTKQHNEMLASIGVEVEKPISTISLENFSDTEPQSFAPVKINVDGSVDNTSKKIEVSDEPAPLVIHREKPQAPARGGGSSQQTKGFSLPFGFFKQKVVQTQTSSAPVRATIEFLKKDELKRAVDYSELRTPLTPFSKKEEGFIKTEELKIQNNPQIVTQKVNPLTMFGGGTANSKEQIANKGVLDIRTTVISNKELVTSNYNKETVSKPNVLGLQPMSVLEKTTPIVPPEIKKQPIIDVQKNILPPTQTPPPSKSFSVPEKPKTPTTSVINTVPKQNIPIEQKNKGVVPPTSGKGFVWFKKPQPTPSSQTPNNNPQNLGPKVNGNTIDLSS